MQQAATGLLAAAVTAVRLLVECLRVAATAVLLLLRPVAVTVLPASVLKGLTADSLLAAGR